MATEVLDILFPGQSATEWQCLGRTVKFDAVMSRTHTRDSQIPDAPLEDGTNANDHIVLGPRKFSMEGVISDHPVDPATVATLQDNPRKRSQEAAFIMESLWELKTEIKVVTRLAIYEHMYFESFTWTENAENGESLTFTAQFKQVRKVSLSLVPIAKLSAPNLAAGQSNRGRQHPKNLNDTDVTSLAKSFQALGKDPKKLIANLGKLFKKPGLKQTATRVTK